MRTLNCIARIPPTSSTVIAHIYPLLVGGCEACTGEDRQWVCNRWRSMEGRMGIGNVEKAREVVEGVWSRRDGAKAPGLNEQPQRSTKLDNVVFDGRALGDGTGLDMSSAWMGATTDEYSFEELFLSGLEGTDQTQLAAPSDKAGLSRTGNIEQDLTVRGSLHWVGVMKDWGWEVLLG